MGYAQFLVFLTVVHGFVRSVCIDFVDETILSSQTDKNMRVSCVYRRSNPHFVPQQTILNSIEIDNKAKIKLNKGILGNLIE